MNIKQKIWLGFGSLLAVVGLGAIASYYQSRQVERDSKELVEVYFAEYTAARDANAAFTTARWQEQRFLAKKDPAAVMLVQSATAEGKKALLELQRISTDRGRRDSAAQCTRLADEYLARFARLNELVVRRGLQPELGLQGDLRKAVHNIEDKVKAQKIAELNVTMLMVRRHEKDYLLRDNPQYFEQITAAVREFTAQMQQLSIPAALQTEFTTLWTQYVASMKALIDGDAEIQVERDGFSQIADTLAAKVNTLAAGATQEITSATAATLNHLSTAKTAVLIGGILCELLGCVIAVWIAVSTTRVLMLIANSISAGAEQTSSAAEQVSSSSQTLAMGASEQAASLEEASSSLEEMASMTQRNAENAVKAKALAAQTRVASDTGTSEMEKMKSAMDDIQSSSNDISKIIKTIDEIAFQTNILALNAAVEAARAGEAGLGFAVVADEVRSLAQRAAASARETAGKIEVSMVRSEHGVRISSNVAAALNEIVEEVRAMDTLVAQIAEASQQQSQGISQVNQAVSQMDKITQGNASTAEESASASEELNSQAAVLKTAANDLLVMIGGGVVKPARRADASALDFPATSEISRVQR